MTGTLGSTVHSISDADEAIRSIRGLGRNIVTFLGFSASGYENQAAVDQLICTLLEELDATTDLVCSGATATGIGAVYAIASSRGFGTVGIVSANAVTQRVKFAEHVDTVYVIEDDSWGGYLDDRRTPSPTSRVMVDASDTLVFIGGGDIARDECDYARRCGKSVRVFAAEPPDASADAPTTPLHP